MLKKLWTITIASILIGIGINAFVVPSKLINGGIWGISLLVNYILGVKLPIIFTCLNLPIYFLAMNKNKSLFVYGLIGSILSAIGVKLLGPLAGMFQLPLFANVVLGGIFIGLGVGMMLRIHASPGGMDLLALMVSRWLSINVGLIMILMDTSIILTGVYILKDERILYSLVIVAFVGFIASVMTSVKSIRLYV
jgi:uncharacterized membrane-anchored protein YitT (DUF2179 family)